LVIRSNKPVAHRPNLANYPKKLLVTGERGRYDIAKQFVLFHSEKLSHLKGEIMSNTSKTDWARIDAMSDDEIDTSDIPPLTDKFFSTAKLRMPSSSLATVAIRVDSETLSWFQSKGEEAEQHMAAALRIYAEAQKNVADIRQSA
jgi:uncharacterized protein (DUF4415 family)